MTQILAGQILKPVIQNKFRVSWGPVDVLDTPETTRYRDAILFQITTINMVSLPQPQGLFAVPGLLKISLEHDVGGAVFGAIEWLKSLDSEAVLKIEVLDGNNTPLQTITYNDVVINDQSFGFDYVSSEPLKSDLTCSFSSFSVQ